MLERGRERTIFCGLFLSEFAWKSKPEPLSGARHRTAHLNNFSSINAIALILTEDDNMTNDQLKMKTNSRART